MKWENSPSSSTHERVDDPKAAAVMEVDRFAPPRRSKSAVALYGPPSETQYTYVPLHQRRRNSASGTAAPVATPQQQELEAARARKKEAKRQSRRSRSKGAASSSLSRSSSSRRHSSSAAASHNLTEEEQQQLLRRKKRKERKERELRKQQKAILKQKQHQAFLIQQQQEEEQRLQEQQQQDETDYGYNQEYQQSQQQQQQLHGEPQELPPPFQSQEDAYPMYGAQDPDVMMVEEPDSKLPAVPSVLPPQDNHSTRSSKSVQTATTNDTATTAPIARQNLRVSFALGPDGAVGRSVHNFANQNYPELWWDEDELMHTLRQCMRTVSSLRAPSGKSYVKSLNRLYHSYKKAVTEAQTSKALQSVAQYPTARGLELHVATKLRQMTQKQRQRVLELQERLRNPHLGGSPTTIDENTLLLLRKEAMKHSRPCRQFAFMIAQYDTHEALKASLAPWGNEDNEEEG